MTLYLSNRDGNGKTSEEGHYRFHTALWTGNVIEPTSLQVTQNSPVGLSVLIAAGNFKIDTDTGYSYTGWSSAPTVQAISAADAVNPRITTIVAYVDKGAATSASPPNNPGIVKFLAVNGTPSASPTAPLDAAVQTAVGVGNPFIRLANIYVAANVTQIFNPNITDVRVQIKIADSVVQRSNISSVSNPAAYPIGSIYINAAVNTNPATLLGFGTWTSFGAGRVLVGYDASDALFNPIGKTGGAKTHTLTEAEIPSHRHTITSVYDDGNYNIPSIPGNGQQSIPYDAGTIQRTQYTNYTGGGAAHNNIQPYVVVYIWRRVA